MRPNFIERWLGRKKIEILVKQGHKNVAPRIILKCKIS